MFSIVIPLYNKELSIRNTVQSVLDQSFQDFEIVIINDGSTDRSVSVVESINDNRVRLLHQSNQGVSAARNSGIREANFSWVVFLDGDDLWRSDHLSVFFRMITAYPADKVFCTSHTKSKLCRQEPESSEIVIIEDYFKEVLEHVDFLWTSAACIDASVFEHVGCFPEGINRGEDLDLWARIGKHYRIIRSRALTATYRIDSENKLTAKKSEYRNSILSTINLKGVKGYERVYFRNMIYRRLKRDIQGGDLVGFFRSVFKHNLELLK